MDSNNIEMKTSLVLTTFDETNQLIKVPIDEEAIFAEDLVRKAGKLLGLKDASLKYFGILEGLHTPVRKFSCVDKVPASAKGLTFQKWCFDINQEKKFLFKDPAALQLLCAQAKAAVEHGRLTPTTEQLQKLEEHSDPSFTVPLPYVTECHSMHGYSSVTIKDCVLFKDFTLKSLQFPEGTGIVLSAAKRGLQLQINGEDYFLSWRKVRRWTRAEENVLMTMVIYSIPSDTYVDLCIKSHQAHYLVAVVMEMIKIMQAELKGPVFQTSDLKRNKRGEIIEWNNITFSTTRFNAEREIAENLVDISTVT
ncbi:uncharacterized protein [Amphiura filiformis]|uniref:uncharacterized protein n=1 Tax=Amphiura filiformis TaxID=82378 RepID=UPI003B20FFC0